MQIARGEVRRSGTDVGRPQFDSDPYVLACQTVLIESCEIEIPEMDEVVVHPAKIIKGTVLAIEELTYDIRRIRVKAAKHMEFSPGQYATLQFTPEHIRPYSFAGLASDSEMEFQVRKVAGGRVTEYVFNQLKVGDSIRISGPLGTAYLRTKHSQPILCVGGGTGIAPVISIVRGAIQAGMKNPIHLYFGVRSQADMYGIERLQNLAQAHGDMKLNIVIAAGPTDTGQRSGLVTDAIQADHPHLKDWSAYFCGAPVMVEALNMLAKQLGIDPAKIHADAFYPSGI